MYVLVDAVRVGLAAFLLTAAVLKLLVRTDLVAAAVAVGWPLPHNTACVGAGRLMIMRTGRNMR